MPLDPNIAMGFKPPQIADPLELAGTAQAMSVNRMKADAIQEEMEQNRMLMPHALREQTGKADTAEFKRDVEHLNLMSQFNDAVLNAAANATDYTDAVRRGARILQAFPDKEGQIGETLLLAKQANEAGKFPEFQRRLLETTIDAKERLEMTLNTISTESGQQIVGTNPYTGVSRTLNTLPRAPVTPQIKKGGDGFYTVDLGTGSARRIMVDEGPASGGGDLPMTVARLKPLVLAQESDGDYTEWNKSGAMGAYQVMPETGKDLAEKLGLDWEPALMTQDTPEARQYQDAIGEAAILDSIKAGEGDAAATFSHYYSGSPTAHKDPKGNPLTAQYTQDMLKRLRRGGNRPSGRRQLQPPPPASATRTAAQEDQLRKDVLKARSQVTSGRAALKELEANIAAVRSLTLGQREAATGWSAYIPSFRASTRAADAAMANLVGKVTALGKAASAESGAPGPMSEQEWKIVRNMIANLDFANMEPDILDQQLDIIWRLALRSAVAQEEDYDTAYGDIEPLPSRGPPAGSGDEGAATLGGEISPDVDAMLRARGI